MTVDFRQLLNRPMDEIKRVPPLPAGTYYGNVVKYEFAESNNKKTPYVRFHVSVSGAGDDVDPEGLKEIDLKKKALRKDYYITPDAEYRIKEFIQSCGIATDGRTLTEGIADTMNAAVILDIVQRPNQQDPNEPPFNDIADMRGAQ